MVFSKAEEPSGDLPKENLALKKKIPSTKIVSLKINWAFFVRDKEIIRKVIMIGKRKQLGQDFL